MRIFLDSISGIRKISSTLYVCKEKITLTSDLCKRVSVSKAQAGRHGLESSWRRALSIIRR